MMSTTIWRQFHQSSYKHNLRKIATITNKSNLHRPHFGIVAAVSKDVIGVNGSLPWNIPQDRDRFVNLTRNKILIVGRKTFSDEDKSGAHIKHARVCIVISRTMDKEDIMNKDGSRDDTTGPQIILARSFDEALDMSSGMLVPAGNNQTISTDDIDIWVAGGERIYREALQHNNAKEVQLTLVNMSVDPVESKGATIAYFPLEYLERFQEVSRVTVENGICTFSVYRKRLSQT